MVITPWQDMHERAVLIWHQATPTLSTEQKRQNGAHDTSHSQTLWKRVTASYAPSAGRCPVDRPRIRVAESLSENETSWLKLRRANTVWALRDFLARANITGLNTNAYIDGLSKNTTGLPNIGIAVSGGGYRALMTGAGAIAAFDNRTTNSTSQGQLGGLLQASTYLSGLSGGSWLVGSLYMQKFAPVQGFIDSAPPDLGTLWQFSNSILQGPADMSITAYYNGLQDNVTAKANAGFPTSITDYWGNALSFQLVNGSDGGPDETFSSIAKDQGFLSGNTPMPIIIANERAPNELIIPSNATIFEFNPWEMGTYGPSIHAFAPLQFVGSNFSNGVLEANEQCVQGLDSASFVMGTSSSLFNQFYLNINGTNAPQVVKNTINGFLRRAGQRNNDISVWPNPFYKFKSETNPSANSTILTLVDGGEDLQNIPLYPLLMPNRNVDVIFAVDGSADTSAPGANWPNGTAMVATYRRSLLSSSNVEIGFPSIPDQNTFINLGLNTRPTFFGCDPGDLSTPSPLIVYLPNSPYTYNSNVSTFTLNYNNSERNSIIQNGYNVATMANGTLDADWITCVGCAILSRSLNRTATATPDVCTQCFKRYCWNGTLNSATPAPYQPTPHIKINGCSGLSQPLLLAATFAFGTCTFFFLK